MDAKSGLALLSKSKHLFTFARICNSHCFGKLKKVIPECDRLLLLVDLATLHH